MYKKRFIILILISYLPPLDRDDGVKCAQKVNVENFVFSTYTYQKLKACHTRNFFIYRHEIFVQGSLCGHFFLAAL